MTPKQKLLLAATATGLTGLGFGYLGHDKIKQHVGYAGYLLPHKYYTGKAAHEMDLPLGTILGHDMSKFRPDEWSAYSAWFNGPEGLQGTKNSKVFMEWKKEVGNHYERNPHHWRALHKHPEDVPMETKLESIADWYGVNRTKGMTKKDFKGWFQERKETFPLDKATVAEAERRLFKTGAKKLIRASRPIAELFTSPTEEREFDKRPFAFTSHKDGGSVEQSSGSLMGTTKISKVIKRLPVRE
jgi:hypothetical protein